MKRIKWSDLHYTRRTMTMNRKRFFSYGSLVLYFLHGIIMLTFILLGWHKWALVSEWTMIGYGLLVLLAPDVISKEITDSPFYYGGIVMPAAHALLVGLLL